MAGTAGEVFYSGKGQHACASSYKDQLHCRRFLLNGAGDGRKSERPASPTSSSHIFEQQKYSSRPIWSMLRVASVEAYSCQRNGGIMYGNEEPNEEPSEPDT